MSTNLMTPAIDGLVGMPSAASYDVPCTGRSFAATSRHESVITPVVPDAGSRGIDLGAVKQASPPRGELR